MEISIKPVKPIVERSDREFFTWEAHDGTKKENRVYRAAVYVRLSKEDGDKEESDSIVNQKELIKSYLSGREDITACMECVDDGYSGADFDARISGE